MSRISKRPEKDVVAVAVAVVVLVATLSLVMMTVVCRTDVVIAATTVADAGAIFISCFP